MCNYKINEIFEIATRLRVAKLIDKNEMSVRSIHNLVQMTTLHRCMVANIRTPVINQMIVEQRIGEKS